MILRQKGLTGQEALAKSLIRPGVKLYGYCGGLFGRDSYGEKHVLEVHGNHIVVSEDGHTLVSSDITGKFYTWSGLVQDSNNALDEWEGEQDE